MPQQRVAEKDDGSDDRGLGEESLVDDRGLGEESLVDDRGLDEESLGAEAVEPLAPLLRELVMELRVLNQRRNDIFATGESTQTSNAGNAAVTPAHGGAVRRVSAASLLMRPQSTSMQMLRIRRKSTPSREACSSAEASCGDPSTFT
jgi:hypothetical protein